MSASGADMVRFFLPSLFPETNRLLYLDNDVIVTCCLEEVWNTKMNEKQIVGELDIVCCLLCYLCFKACRLLLCYDMICHYMLCYDMKCHDKLCYATLCYHILCYVML